MRRQINEAEVLKRLSQGPFLLLEEGVSPSPYYQVVDTPLGPAVFPTEKRAASLGYKWRSAGEGSHLRKLFIRALAQYALSRELPFYAEGNAALIGPPGKAVFVVLALSAWRLPPLPKPASLRVIVSPNRRKGGLWVPLAPGCLQDLYQVLDAHLFCQPEDEPAPPA
jgi:hypothetical protein